MNIPIKNFHADVKRLRERQAQEPQVYRTQAERWYDKNVMLDQPGHECKWKVGDVVRFTNEVDIEFGPFRVIGFTKPEDELYGRFIYIDWDNPWFPVRPEELSAY